MLRSVTLKPYFLTGKTSAFAETTMKRSECWESEQ